MVSVEIYISELYRNGKDTAVYTIYDVVYLSLIVLNRGAFNALILMCNTSTHTLWWSFVIHLSINTMLAAYPSLLFNYYFSIDI